MRNKYGGKCYRCSKYVNPGEGHFERHSGSWRVQHAMCAIENRAKPTIKLRKQMRKDK